MEVVILKEHYMEYIHKLNLQDFYSNEEIEKSYESLQKFLGSLNELTIEGRKLTQFEEFIIIYEFVTNRVYKECDKSHDIIGVLNGKYAVCQGFTQLMQFICEEKQIPFLYKRVTTFDENENYLGSHGNFQVIIKNNDGIECCLHCDSTIDCLKTEDDVMSYNSFLINSRCINDFYHTQIPDAGFNETLLFWDIAIDEVDETIKAEKMKEFSIIDQFNGLTSKEVYNNNIMKLYNQMLSLKDFFGIEISTNIASDKDILIMYRNMYLKYKSMDIKIERTQLYKFIQDIYKKIFNSPKVNFLIEKRLSKTNENDVKYWKKSFRNMKS